MDGDHSARQESGRLDAAATGNVGGYLDSVTVNSSACSPDQPSSNNLLFSQRMVGNNVRLEEDSGDYGMGITPIPESESKQVPALNSLFTPAEITPIPDSESKQAPALNSLFTPAPLT